MSTLRTGSYIKYLFRLNKLTLQNLSSPKPLNKLGKGEDEERKGRIVEDIV